MTDTVPGARRHLLVTACLNALLLAAVLLEKRHLSASHAPLMGAFYWLVVANGVSTALVLGFAWVASWSGALRSTLRWDAVVQLMMFLAFIPLNASNPTATLLGLGYLYAALVFFRGALLVRFALANAQGTHRSRRVWVFAVSLLTLASLTGWTKRVSWPNGDGPHYLLLTQSLVADHDFNLRNNYANWEYAAFFPPEVPGDVADTLLARRENNTKVAVGLEHHTVRGAHGEELLWHDIGVSLIVLPGYALAGRTGALLMLDLVAAALALVLFELAFMLSGVAASALLAWALFMSSAPIVTFTGELFPEMMGAAALAGAALGFLKFRESGSKLQLLFTGSLLAALPWICVRYWVPGGVLCLGVMAFLVSSRERPGTLPLGKALALLLMPGVLSLLLFSWFDWTFFRSLLPNAGYRAIVSTDPQFWLRPHVGLLGLFLDRAYGLLPSAPIYVVAFAGAWLLKRRDRWAAVVLLGPAIVYALFMSCSKFWFGGCAPAGRYLLAGIVLLPPASALVLTNLRNRRIALVLASWGWICSLIYSAVPVARYPSIYDPNLAGVDEFARDGKWFRFTFIFPSIGKSEPFDFGLALVWLALVIGVGVFLVKSSGRSAPSPVQFPHPLRGVPPTVHAEPGLEG